MHSYIKRPIFRMRTSLICIENSAHMNNFQEGKHWKNIQICIKIDEEVYNDK